MLCWCKQEDQQQPVVPDFWAEWPQQLVSTRATCCHFNLNYDHVSCQITMLSFAIETTIAEGQ